MDDVRLYEFDKEEWWDVLSNAIRLCCGEPMSREQFDKAWDEFQEIKRRKAMQ